jgi:hypothetical protein
VEKLHRQTILSSTAKSDSDESFTAVDEFFLAIPKQI